jgi:hypothetical protein
MVIKLVEFEEEMVSIYKGETNDFEDQIIAALGAKFILRIGS